MDDIVKHYCSRCGVEFDLAELKILPEMEEHARELSRHLTKGTPRPADVDDAALREKYNVDPMGLFCPDCLQKIVDEAESSN